MLSGHLSIGLPLILVSSLPQPPTTGTSYRRWSRAFVGTVCTRVVSCAAPMLRHSVLLGLSSDTNEGFVACRHIFTMLYFTYNDQQKNNVCLDLSNPLRIDSDVIF